VEFLIRNTCRYSSIGVENRRCCVYTLLNPELRVLGAGERKSYHEKDAGPQLSVADPGILYLVPAHP
jgi:hypothetical protein